MKKSQCPTIICDHSAYPLTKAESYVHRFFRIGLPQAVGFAFALTISQTISAGTLGNGKWTPGKCGASPEVPVISGENVDVYNAGVEAANIWQQESRKYLECMVNEANNDNSLISETAKREQETYLQQLEKISTDSKIIGEQLKQQ